jgi:hypothetical protein
MSLQCLGKTVKNLQPSQIGRVRSVAGAEGSQLTQNERVGFFNNHSPHELVDRVGLFDIDVVADHVFVDVDHLFGFSGGVTSNDV